MLKRVSIIWNASKKISQQYNHSERNQMLDLLTHMPFHRIFSQLMLQSLFNNITTPFTFSFSLLSLYFSLIYNIDLESVLFISDKVVCSPFLL